MGHTYRWRWAPRVSPRGCSGCSTRHEALQRDLWQRGLSLYYLNRSNMG